MIVVPTRCEVPEAGSRATTVPLALSSLRSAATTMKPSFSSCSFALAKRLPRTSGISTVTTGWSVVTVGPEVCVTDSEVWTVVAVVVSRVVVGVGDPVDVAEIVAPPVDSPPHWALRYRVNPRTSAISPTAIHRVLLFESPLGLSNSGGGVGGGRIEGGTVVGGTISTGTDMDPVGIILVSGGLTAVSVGTGMGRGGVFHPVRVAAEVFGAVDRISDGEVCRSVCAAAHAKCEQLWNRRSGRFARARAITSSKPLGSAPM